LSNGITLITCQISCSEKQKSSPIRSIVGTLRTLKSNVVERSTPAHGVEAIKLHLSLFRLMNHSHTLMMEAINKERDGFVMGEGTSVLVWIVDIMFLNI
jgi:hypothetical protein